VALACALAPAACSGGTTPGPVVTHTVTAAPRPAPASSAVAAGAPKIDVQAKPKPKPEPNHCAQNPAPQKVIVSIAAQHMWLCARHRTVRDNPITSGMAGPYTQTPTGNFVIQGRERNTVLTLNTGEQYPVHYWIPFEGPLFGFHDSTWQTFPYGSPKYRTAGSHGCIHMPLAAIAFLYRWSMRPTAVHIS
jgi:hypothetical protein